ncbi:hypothetical protein ACV229_26385 [Burkholderia sp. MR1-5-21]
MNADTFEQIVFPRKPLAHSKNFFSPICESRCSCTRASPSALHFPPAVELSVVSTPPGLHEHETSTFKTATLESGMEVLVPQFIKEEDTVRIEIASGRYLERVRRGTRKP